MWCLLWSSLEFHPGPEDPMLPGRPWGGLGGLLLPRELLPLDAWPVRRRAAVLWVGWGGGHGGGRGDWYGVAVCGKGSSGLGLALLLPRCPVWSRNSSSFFSLVLLLPLLLPLPLC